MLREQMRDMHLKVKNIVILTIKAGKIKDPVTGVYTDKLFAQKSMVMGYDPKMNQILVTPLAITKGYKSLDKINLNAISDVIVQG